MPSVHCPAEGCSKTYFDLGTLFQHVVRNHNFKQRYIVIDQKEGFVSLVDQRDFPKKIREELQPPPRVELEVPA